MFLAVQWVFQCWPNGRIWSDPYGGPMGGPMGGFGPDPYGGPMGGFGPDPFGPMVALVDL